MLTAEQVIAWLERNHYDLVYRFTLDRPRWIVYGPTVGKDRYTTDQIAEGVTILEAISKASQELLRAGSL